MMGHRSSGTNTAGREGGKWNPRGDSELGTVAGPCPTAAFSPIDLGAPTGESHNAPLGEASLSGK